MSTTPPEPEAAPRRAVLVWQQWFDGELRRPPVALADGALAVVEHAEGSTLRRLDGDGAIVWEVPLGGRATGDPVRSHGHVAIPLDERRVVVHTLAEGARAGGPVGLPGLALNGPIAALHGHLLARFGSRDEGAEPFLAVLDLERPDASPHLLRDPLERATEARFRATNHAFVMAGEDAAGHVTIAAVDAQSHLVLWRHAREGCGLTYLWAAGGLIDVVLTDRVTAFEARSGLELTTRFEGMVLEAARIAGETLVTALGEPDDPETRELMTFDTMTEEPTGQLRGFRRVVGACSDEVLLADLDDGPALFELPSLIPIPIHDGDAIVGPRLVAWSRHRAWIVGHGGHSLSAIDL